MTIIVTPCTLEPTAEAVVSGPVASFGSLGFEIDFYKNQDFGELVVGPFRVGTSLYCKGSEMIKN